PFGFGGAMGTGTGTTACAGAVGRDGPAGGGGGACGAIGEGAGAFCCASDMDPASRQMQTKMRVRFIDESLRNRNEVIENQIAGAVPDRTDMINALAVQDRR